MELSIDANRCFEVTERIQSPGIPHFTADSEPAAWQTDTILADFNGTVLAGIHGKYDVEFVTWDWDHDRKRLSHGHYFTDNYEGARQDFATRSGLIPEQQFFQDEQRIKSVQEQI